MLQEQPSLIDRVGNPKDVLSEIFCCENLLNLHTFWWCKSWFAARKRTKITLNMLAIVIILHSLSFIILNKLAILARKVEILRGNVTVNDSIQIKNYHLAPIPFFTEPNDSEEIKRMVRRRGLFVILFWLCFMTCFAICFVHSPPTNANWALLGRR